jgi:hypothetical protein
MEGRRDRRRRRVRLRAGGARVFLAGRTPATLEVVADEIRGAGGTADTAQVDSLDELAARAGGIDISFNLIAHPFTHGTAMAEMAVDDFLAPCRRPCARPS